MGLGVVEPCKPVICVSLFYFASERADPEVIAVRSRFELESESETWFLAVVRLEADACIVLSHDAGNARLYRYVSIRPW